MEWRMMPRIAALSELQWADPKKKDLRSFLVRLQHQLDLYTLHGYHFKEDIFEVAISVQEKEKTSEASVTLESFDEAPIYYTLDGSVPSSTSTLYQHPFSIKDSAKIKAIVLRKNDKPSPISEIDWKADGLDK